MRERQSERVRCACGVSILASYREKHNQTHRHQIVMALLGNGDHYNILARSSSDTAVVSDEERSERDEASRQKETQSDGLYEK